MHPPSGKGLAQAAPRIGGVPPPPPPFQRPNLPFWNESIQLHARIMFFRCFGKDAICSEVRALLSFEEAPGRDSPLQECGVFKSWDVTGRRRLVC